MKSFKSNIRPTPCLGHPRYAGMQKSRKGTYGALFSFCFPPYLPGSKKRGVLTSVRQLFKRLMNHMEFGFAANYTMDLFTKGAISRDEMLARIDELEHKFNRDKN